MGFQPVQLSGSHASSCNSYSPCGKSPETRRKAPHRYDGSSDGDAGEDNSRTLSSPSIAQSKVNVEGLRLKRNGAYSVSETYLFNVIEAFY